MNSNGIFQDPYCRREFWENQLSEKSHAELTECLTDFEKFSVTVENDFRIVMSASRAKVCLEVLENLIRQRTSETKNVNQGDLFDTFD